MSEIISKLDNQDILALCGIFVGLVAVVGVITVAVTQVVSSHRRRAQRDEIEGSLKMSMIERGLSAAEIKQILETRMDSHQCANLAALFGGLKPPPAPVFGAQPAKA